MRVVTLVFVASLAMAAACSQQAPSPPPRGAAGQSSEEEQSPLVGQPAPAVDLELLDGGRFSLASQRGQQVVILDFWATWCGPCVREMPIVAEVAHDYRKRGVSLYCLNQGEDADTVRAFLEEKQLDVMVGLDAQREAAEAYGVEGIPTLALIDKAGVVRGVHVGYRPDIGEKLREELDAILGEQPSNAESQAALPAASDKAPRDAKAVLRQAADFYQQTKTFQADYSQTIDSNFNGLKNRLEWQAKIVVERPNRIALRSANGQLGMDVVSDGGQLSMNMAAFKRYTQSDAPESIDELLADPLMKQGAGGRGPLLEIFSEHAYEKLTKDLTKAEYAGREKVGDVDAHHLKLEQPQLNWEVWIAAQGEPRLLQASFDLAGALAAGGLDKMDLKNMRATSVQHYKNWQFDMPVEKDAFAFEPPADSEKVESFFAEAPGGKAEPSPLVGKPAPDIEQELLDGSHFSLKSHKGKKVVILDFWATWCGPCVKAMPLVAKVAEEYRGKNVALYCVNQREEADAIRDFLEEKEIEVAVSLDAEGATGDAYGVEGIPTLVLIDKAGVVQRFRVGYSPDIEQELKDDLDAILAGKNLAAEAEREASAKAAEPAAAAAEPAEPKDEN